MGEEELIENILIHLSFEEFKAVELSPNKESSHYEITRMCPPGQVWFFFTINKEQRFSNLYNLGPWFDKEVKNVQIGSKIIDKILMDEMNYVDVSPIK